MEFNHKPVLFTETIESLAIRPEGVYIDGTMGGGCLLYTSPSPRD